MAISLYTQSLGSTKANLQVVIRNATTQVPVSIYNSGSALLNTQGLATLDASGNLSAYVDTAVSLAVSVISQVSPENDEAVPLSAAQKAAGAVSLYGATADGTLVAPDGTTTFGSAVKSLVSKAGNTSRLLMLGNSITAMAKPGIIGESYTAGNWAPGGSVSVGQTLGMPTTDLTAGMPFRKAQCIQAGTMGTTEPLWPTAIGGTVTDGTVVWQVVASAGSAAFWNLSWWSIAQALAGQPLDEQYIVGQSGRQSDTILATLYDGRIDFSKVDVVYFANIFENDCWPGGAPTLSTITTRFAAYVAAVDYVRLTLQKRVMVQTVLPSGNIDTSGGGFTGYSRGNGTKAWVWLNQKIREMARARQDVILFEPDLLYVDPSPANGAGAWPENATTYIGASVAGQFGKRTDAIHPYMAAHWLIGSALAKVLTKYFQAPARFGASSSEQTLTVNPLKGQGTGGTAGTNVTGTVAQGYTVNNYVLSSTGAGTASLVARSDISGNWQRIAYTAAASADGANCALNGQTAAGTIAAGDLIQGYFEIRVLANPTLLTAFDCVMRQWPAGTSYDAKCGGLGTANDQDIGQFITADTTFVWKTAPVAAQAGFSGVSTYPKVLGRGAASFTADFGRESVQRVGVPALA